MHPLDQIIALRLGLKKVNGWAPFGPLSNGEDVDAKAAALLRGR